MTQEQRLYLITQFAEARKLADALPLDDIAEDTPDFELFHRRVSEARVALGRLDAHVFRMYGELYHMQHPQTVVYHVPKPDPRPFTIDDL